MTAGGRTGNHQLRAWLNPRRFRGARGRMGRLSVNPPLNGRALSVRKPWTTDGKPDKVVAGRENGQIALAYVGYARVSPLDQDPALQRDALAAAGCAKVFLDRASGIKTDRAGLLAALAYARDGD